jgi:hypothetical protein
MGLLSFGWFQGRLKEMKERTGWPGFHKLRDDGEGETT